jgi:cytosolic carboxypeptidase protein 2/3
LLCKTLGGNRVDLLTITEKGGSQEEVAKRKGVVLTARIHPGESNGSYVMKGIIEFLTAEDNAEAELLRKNFVFKIVPMINVDGVIYGNYRTSLAGIDLNRTWKRPDPVLFPEVTAIKKEVAKFNQ